MDNGPPCEPSTLVCIGILYLDAHGGRIHLVMCAPVTTGQSDDVGLQLLFGGRDVK